MFNDQVIWLTGASSGIGEALALALSQAGARLILSARRSAELERVRANCDRPDEHLVLPLDVTDYDAIQHTIQLAKQWTAHIDIVIFNAGISQRSLICETDLSVDEQIMRVNYFGVIAHTKSLLPTLLEQEQAQIVVVSSLVGKFATPLRSAYAASKHALHGFFETLRAELKSEGIEVTLICPGYVRTQVSVNALTGDGTPQGLMDAAQSKGMNVDRFARKALKAIKAQRAEVYIGGKEVLGIWVHRFFPKLFRFLIRRVTVT